MAKHQTPKPLPAKVPGAVPPAPEPPAPEPPAHEPPAPARFRVRWHFTGFRPYDLNEGDEVEATEDEAAPFVGGVLSRLQDPS